MFMLRNVKVKVVHEEKTTKLKFPKNVSYRFLQFYKKFNKRCEFHLSM